MPALRMALEPLTGGAMSDAIAKTPQPPYYAVIFSSLRTEGDNGYGATAARMEELARQQPGFLGIESARSGLGITVGYFRSLEDIAAWKKHVEHAEAQRRGRADWYAAYRVRIAKVERDYGFAKA
jgi:heme-degrading monooxygenase HmoA